MSNITDTDYDYVECSSDRCRKYSLVDDFQDDLEIRKCLQQKRQQEAEKTSKLEITTSQNQSSSAMLRTEEHLVALWSDKYWIKSTNALDKKYENMYRIKEELCALDMKINLEEIFSTLPDAKDRRIEPPPGNDFKSSRFIPLQAGFLDSAKSCIIVQNRQILFHRRLLFSPVTDTKSSSKLLRGAINKLQENSFAILKDQQDLFDKILEKWRKVTHLKVRELDSRAAKLHVVIDQQVKNAQKFNSVIHDLLSEGMNQLEDEPKALLERLLGEDDNYKDLVWRIISVEEQLLALRYAKSSYIEDLINDDLREKVKFLHMLVVEKDQQELEERNEVAKKMKIAFKEHFQLFDRDLEFIKNMIQNYENQLLNMLQIVESISSVLKSLGELLKAHGLIGVQQSFSPPQNEDL